MPSIFDLYRSVFGGESDQGAPMAVQNTRGGFDPYRPPPVPDALELLKSATGYTDLQQAGQAYQRGEYLPAFGQGAWGGLQAASTAFPVLKAGGAALKAGAPLAREAAAALPGLLADETGAIRIARTLDTNRPPANPNDWNSGYLRGAGWWEPERGVIAGTHVTDDPSIVTRMLQSGGPLTNRGPDKYGDLGPGLYFSDSPQVWGSRSRSKWDFLDELTKDQRENLAGTLASEIGQLPKGYVTTAERDAAIKSIDYFRTGQAPPQVLLNVADQPYNIDLANPEFLKRLGITPGRQPVEAPIEVGGRFAQLDRNVYGNEADILRDQGYQGAFTQGGFSTTPQFVVWDRDAVKSFNRIPVGLRGLLGLSE